jgi:hypothetical protein
LYIRIIGEKGGDYGITWNCGSGEIEESAKNGGGFRRFMCSLFDEPVLLGGNSLCQRYSSDYLSYGSKYSTRGHCPPFIRLSEATRRGQELAISLKDTAATLAELRKKHESLKEGAAGYLELKAAHEATQSELETTRLELGELTKQYEELRSSVRWKWFGTGAGVFFSALVFGIVLGRQQKRRRSSYY